jgi:hypothetical protein
MVWCASLEYHLHPVERVSGYVPIHTVPKGTHTHPQVVYTLGEHVEDIPTLTLWVDTTPTRCYTRYVYVPYTLRSMHTQEVHPHPEEPYSGYPQVPVHHVGST